MSAAPQLNKSANHPTDRTSTAGGGMSGTQITNAGAGEWCPQLKALASGVVNVDTVFQIQEAYVNNAGADPWTACGFYVDNLLVRPGTPGVLNLQSSSASDDNTKFVRVWGVTLVMSVLTLIFRDITLNGITMVTGLDTFQWVERLEKRIILTGALDPAAGLIAASIGTGTPEVIGGIPVAYTCASSEWEYAVAATQGDTGTYADRETDPFGGGGTWVRPNLPSNMLAMPADMAAGDKFAVYCRETLQPAIGSVPALKRANKLYGIV